MIMTSYIDNNLGPVLMDTLLYVQYYLIMNFEPGSFFLNFFLLPAQFEKIRLIDQKIGIIYLVKRLWKYPGGDPASGFIPSQNAQ